MKIKHSLILETGAYILAVAILIAAYALLRTPRVESPIQEIVEEVREEEEVTETQEPEEEDNSELIASLNVQEPPASLDHSSWPLNELENLSVSFKAPSAFEWKVEPIQRVTVDGNDFGDHGLGSIVVPEDEYSSAAIVSVAPLGNTSGRGAYWGDIVSDVEDKVDCDILTSHWVSLDVILSCSSFINENGHEVIHVVSNFVGFSSNEALINLYVVAHPDPEIRTVLFSDERLLPRDNYRASVVEHIASAGFDTVQSSRNLVRTMVDTLEFIQ
jgi:hypothetical protein